MKANNEIISNNTDKNKWQAPQIQQLNVKDTKDGSINNGKETIVNGKITKGVS